MSEHVDWTTTDGCPRCNEHGPFFEWDYRAGGAEWSRDLHHAEHAIAAAFLGPLVPLIDRLNRALTPS